MKIPMMKSRSPVFENQCTYCHVDILKTNMYTLIALYNKTAWDVAVSEPPRTPNIDHKLENIPVYKNNAKFWYICLKRIYLYHLKNEKEKINSKSD